MVSGGCEQFWLILGGCGLLVLANFRWLSEVMGDFDNSVQCWKVLGGFGCLRLVLGSCVRFWLVLGSCG